MLMNDKLTAVIEKYRNHPEFLGIAVDDPNQPGAVDDTLLHLAARSGAVGDLEVLVESGARVNVLGDLGNTPLHQAAMNGQLSSIRKLLELGADAKLRNEFGQTALQVAELGGHAEVVRVLKVHLPREL
jgi:ankyrin repeat protein